MRENTKYIHAEKNQAGIYEAYEISKTLKELTDNYEYGDVKDNNYQIWEYPNGKIFNVTVSNEVSEDEYYSPPINWEPKLVHVATDKKKVEEAYERLSNPPKRQPLLSRFVRKMFGK